MVNIKPRIQLENREPLAENIPLSTPWVIFVDPSDICNFRCKFCPTSNVKLLKKVKRPLTLMDFELYKKIIDDICKFDKPIKVLRLYLYGEPLLNPNFPMMVKYAKESGCCERVDTTTNGSLLNPQLNLEIINAGLDRINISIEGVNAKQYKSFSDYVINWGYFIDNIKHFYENRQQCEVIIKINGDFLSEDEKEEFYNRFGDICDGISIEHTMNCWYGFDGAEQNKDVGLYGQEIKRVEVCPYVFYQMSINSDGIVTACFIDWARQLIIGNAKYERLIDIWKSSTLKSFQEMMLCFNRKYHPICSNCSQLTHGMPVDLDDKAFQIYNRWKK